MKSFKFCFLLFGISIIVSCSQQSNEYDLRAVQKLDTLVETIGDLESCSFTLNVRKNLLTNPETTDTIFTEHDVYLRGPDKMYIYSKSAENNIAYWYDGDSLSYFSFSKNKYRSFKAPENILATIDAIHEKYGVDFPAADFFYPTLTDDILNFYDFVYYLGEVESNGEKYIHIEASTEKEILGLWISSKTNLPAQLLIENNAGEFYEAQFSNWRLNPDLNDEMFLFTPPAGAEIAQKF